MTNELSEAVGSWEAITEEQFLQAHESFLQSLSLVPVLTDDIPEHLYTQLKESEIL